jgi:hypothetical protein
MNLGGILDRGVQVFRARAPIFIGLGSITGIAHFAYQLVTAYPESALAGSANRGPRFESPGATLVSWLALAGLGAIVQAATCYAASRVILGEQVSIRKVFGAFTSKVWLLIWLTILQGFYAGWPFLVATFVSVIATSPGSAEQGVIVLIGLIPCVVLFTRYALAFPAIVIERFTPQASIERSINLGAGGRWRVFWGVIVPYVPALMLTYVVPGVMNALQNSNAFPALNSFLVAGINGFVGLISALVFTPYVSIVLTLLYYDQRMRREGFDVEWMMQAAGLDANAALQAGDPETPSSRALEGQA